MNEHAEALEVDLLAMGVDILDLGTERLSWRRLRALIARLPRDSWTVQAIAGDRARWGDQEHLLATIVDALQQGNWMFAAANSKHSPDPPSPIRRPGDPDPTVRLGGTRTLTPAEFRRLQAGMKPKARVN